MTDNYVSGLEVDIDYLNGYLEVYSNTSTSHLDTGAAQVPSFSQSDKIIPEAKRQIFGFRKSTFWLVTALIAVLAMGVIGISVAGYIAARRKTDADRKYETRSPLRDRLSIVNNFAS